MFGVDGNLFGEMGSKICWHMVLKIKILKKAIADETCEDNKIFIIANVTLAINFSLRQNLKKNM